MIVSYVYKIEKIIRICFCFLFIVMQLNSSGNMSIYEKRCADNSVHPFPIYICITLCVSDGHALELLAEEGGGEVEAFGVVLAEAEPGAAADLVFGGESYGDGGAVLLEQGFHFRFQRIALGG